MIVGIADELVMKMMETISTRVPLPKNLSMYKVRYDRTIRIQKV